MDTQQQPIHWDQHRSTWNLTLIFSLVVLVLGIAQGAQILIALGLVFAGYTWLTTPRQYLIYRDALVIRYGNPRVKPIPFAAISHLESLALPMGERLRIRTTDGKRTFLMAKDPDTFRQRLEEALVSYNDFQGGGGAWVETRGSAVDERAAEAPAEQPLDTSGTVLDSERPSYGNPLADSLEPEPEAPFDPPPEPDFEGERATETADDPRGPITSVGDATTPGEENKPPY